MQLSKQIEAIFFGPETQFKFKDLLDKIDEKSFGLLLVILALPAALPFTPPGISTPFALVLLPLGWQLLQNKDKPWFPQKIAELEIDTTKNPKFARLLLLSAKWLEKLFYARWLWFFKYPSVKRLLGLAVVINALILTLPFPITNTPPSVAILLIGLGLLSEDGLAAILGLLCTILAIVVVTIILFLISIVGWSAFDLFKSYLYQWLNLG